jgi:hypothetical protein
LLWQSLISCFPFCFIFSWVSYKWNCALCSLVCLASLTPCNAAQIHPCRCCGHHPFPYAAEWLLFLMEILSLGCPFQCLWAIEIFQLWLLCMGKVPVNYEHLGTGLWSFFFFLVVNTYKCGKCIQTSCEISKPCSKGTDPLCIPQ